MMCGDSLTILPYNFNEKSTHFVGVEAEDSGVHSLNQSRMDDLNLALL
jgi:hypothetical protein